MWKLRIQKLRFKYQNNSKWTAIISIEIYIDHLAISILKAQIAVKPKASIAGGALIYTMANTTQYKYTI